MRVLRRIKQVHLAELLGVSQATVSRWESGTIAPDEEHGRRIRELLNGSLDHHGDRALKRLVESSALPIHLICDATHRLLAASPARERDWGRSVNELEGVSLWPFASRELEEAELKLAAKGWQAEPPTSELGSQPATIWTAGNSSNSEVRINPSLVLWERMSLTDGSIARLVTTLKR